MLLRYFYDEKLAHASYLVGCQATGEAIVIDPARDVVPYVKTAQAEGLKVVAAAETHIHADFVSGARELGEEHGATLYVSGEGGPDWSYAYVSDGEGGASIKHWLVRDGERFQVGRLEFEVLHTPGHTPESVSFLLTDRGGGADSPMGIFTGDFVFVGDIGRPDLLEKAVGLAGTAAEGARQMYRSLQRFKQLPDYVQVWPAHGAGSACGKALGAIPSSTVGYEKRFNWALSMEDEPAFTAALLAGQPEPPTYFPRMKRVNRDGPELLARLPVPEWIEGTITAVSGLAEEDAVVIDTRSSTEFASGHVKGTINLPFNRSFTTWAGWFVDDERPLYVMGEADQLPEIVRDMRSIGIDRIAGTIEVSRLWSGIDAAASDLESYREVAPADIADQVLGGKVAVVDVRSGAEWEEGRIPGASHILLGTLPGRIREVPEGKPVLLQCRTGARSAIAASILQAHGSMNVMNLQGGIIRWREEGLPIAK
jgi:hydroxyacylglutathione hydrolase